jgi:hypothetical protein
MSEHDLSRARWRKSSYSGNTGNCVEVTITDTVVGIRDSKHPNGPVLRLTREQWHGFMAYLNRPDVAN